MVVIMNKNITSPGSEMKVSVFVKITFMNVGQNALNVEIRGLEVI
jgi:hypothetical protein